MIIDRLENLAAYVSIHPFFAEVFDYLKGQDLLAAAPGKIQLRGEDILINITQTTPKLQEEAKLETHVKYIDIQIPLSGTEVMGYSPASACSQVLLPYDAEKDVAFYEGEAQNYLAVSPGMFAVFFPQDAHAPGITPTGVKKVIVKVKSIP